MKDFSSGYAAAILMQILFHLPTIAVCTVGIVLAFIKSKKHSRVALLSGTAFGILLFLNLLSILLSILPFILTSQKFDAVSIGYIFSAIGFVTTVIFAVAAALLLGAIWKDRA